MKIAYNKNMRDPYPFRNESLFEAAKKLGVSHGAIRNWINKGAPYAAKQFGKSKRYIYVVNSEELKKWLDIPTLADVKIFQNILQKIKDKLGLTLKEIAETLKIKNSTMNTYFYPDLYSVKRVPLELISEAKHLLKTGIKHKHPWDDHSSQEVIRALKLNKGSRKQTSKFLHMDTKRLNRLIIKYNLTHLVRYYYRDPKAKEIRKILKLTKGRTEAATKLLHISNDKLTKLVRKYKLKNLTRHKISDYLSRPVIIKELIKTKGDIKRTIKNLRCVFPPLTINKFKKLRQRLNLKIEDYQSRKPKRLR